MGNGNLLGLLLLDDKKSKLAGSKQCFSDSPKHLSESPDQSRQGHLPNSGEGSHLLVGGRSHDRCVREGQLRLQFCGKLWLMVRHEIFPEDKLACQVQVQVS